MYGDKTPLQVQLQMLNQITLFQASINLKLLETQVAANKISTLKEYVEFSENLRSKLKKSLGGLK
jgi:metal-dependent HD superfamily phosphatase/phosphodiesterase